MLVLGADSNGRTDAVMVVGVDIDAKQIHFASIPRDTINIPLPHGGIFRGEKINAFWNAAAADPTRYPEGPDRAMTELVGGLLDIRIDYVARTNFDGFKSLVDQVGGIPIVLAHVVRDNFLEWKPGTFGITFPAGRQVLDGRKALAFVRIRHLDNDFERQRRQQQFLESAGLFALTHPAAARAILAASSGRIVTNFPLDTIDEYATLLSGLNAKSIDGVVLGPRTYESAASCTCGYALAPNLTAMRREAARLFPWAVAT
jgi:polyisoprenyl-teichoic acid--peptidoglycan teichoic acid transferase